MRVWIITSLLVCSGVVAAADLNIVRDGRSEYVIVTPTKPSDAEDLAAKEIARYLKKISGADIAIQREDASGEIPAKAIIISKTGGLASAGDGFISTEDDSIEVRPRGESLLLRGKSDRAVLYAAYQFLDALGCRFLAPELDYYHGSAEVIPNSGTLIWPERRAIESKPAFAFRKLYVEEGHSHTAENLKQMAEWMSKVGFNTLVIPMDYQGGGRVKWDNWRKDVTPELRKRGIVIEVGGHGYQNFLNADMPAAEGGTLFENHPDWFARDERGVRHKEQNWVFNTANPQAVHFLVNNVLAYVQERPEIEIFDLWPPDSERWDESAEGRAQGTPTDRMVMFTNLVQAEVAKVRPGMRLECIAYARYTEPPQKQNLDKRVLVDFCPIAQSFEVPIFDASSATNSNYVTDLKGWRQAFNGDISLYSYYRKYAWQSLPLILPRYMQEDLKFYKKLPLQGISSYAEPGDWFTYELNYYALAQLAWNPDVNVDAIAEKFCTARFGLEAPAALAALNVLSDTVHRYGSIPGTSLKPAEAIDLARNRIKQAISNLSKAAIDTADPIIRRNLSRLELECRYAEQDMHIQSMRSAKMPQNDIRKVVESLNDLIVQNRDQGVFLIHGARLSLPRLLERYGFEASVQNFGTRLPVVDDPN